MDFKEELFNSLKKQINEPFSLEIPPSLELGNFSLPCFKLSKKAPELQKLLKLPHFIEKTEIKGPYLNFFINKDIFVNQTINQILKEKDKFGSSHIGKGRTIVIDLSSPNIAKPFGIGHLRSTIIGNAIGNICSKMGFKVVKINYLGDWGTQFGKLIVGFKHFGSEKELKKDPINHLYSLYVKVNSIPELEDESRLYFKKLEDGDEECIKLWERFKELSLKNFSEIYDLLNIKFDILSGESLYNNKMDKTVKLLEKKGLLQEDDNAQIIDLEEYNLGKCLIKKSDGATLYMTRDLTAAIDRYEKYGFSRMFYEVGSEQKLHFKQLFKILELMGYEWAKDCVHIDHGLYLDSDGKKFATRKGKTVFMIDVLRETVSIANKIIEEKNPNLENRESIAKKIGVAAIILGDLKNNRITDMIFDIDKFLDFEGNTGPYLQYTYARASSIIKKGKTIRYKKALISNNIEYQLINLLSKMPYITEDSYSKLSPHIISTYCIELARLFNEFYHQCPVLNEPNKDIQSFRLALVQSTRQVIKNSLSILGIECPESM